MIIMKYHELGDLTHYVTNNFFEMSWSDKLQILDYIISGLKNILYIMQILSIKTTIVEIFL